jgi:hypothetical protein
MVGFRATALKARLLMLLKLCGNNLFLNSKEYIAIFI